MASSVSSERAFSSAGITISKRRNRLRADVIEALQFLKCWFRRDLIFREEPTVKWELSSIANENHDKEDDEGDGSWEDGMLNDADEDAMDIEPDGDNDDDVFLFQLT